MKVERSDERRERESRNGGIRKKGKKERKIGS